MVELRLNVIPRDTVPRDYLYYVTHRILSIPNSRNVVLGNSHVTIHFNRIQIETISVHCNI